MSASAASTNDCAIAKNCTMMQQLPLVGAVGDEPGERAEQQDRRELTGGEEPDRDAAVGEREDEQRLGDERQPVADLRDPLADEEQAEVADTAAS